MNKPSIKKINNLKLILFFSALTLASTAVVILAWEKLLLPPFFSWVEARYPGDQNADRRWKIQQRTEHFFISVMVDVLVVTLLLRLASRQQRQLRASEERYRALFEHASDGIGVMTAADHRLLEVNNQFCSILGCSPDKLVGKNIRELDHVLGESTISQIDDPLMGSRELVIRSFEGQSLPVSISSTTLSTGDEKLVILIIHDLSEQKRLATEKEEIQRQLFQSSKMAAIGELSAGVAHEINNPLNCIINFGQLLKDEKVTRTPMEQQVIDGIIDEGARIAKIVHNLLAFARLDSNEHARVDVAETIKNTVSVFGHQLQRDGVSVEIDVATNLPPVKAEGSRLRQVLVNMITNAHHSLKAKSSETKVFRITARALEEEGHPIVRLEFFDNGIGIKQENIEKVFDPFFTTRRDSGGTGLGLSLSFGIIRDYGGSLTVESEEGRYTSFRVTLPAVAMKDYEHADSVAGG